MAEPSFEKSVFINCPFDRDYQGILQAVLFCILYLGYKPQIATLSQNSGDVRLQKILSLLEGSKYSIHDLSRSEAASAGDIFRLNMPFELGVDYGCRRYFEAAKDKKILILEEQRYRYQKALSDLAGCDIQAHEGDFQKAVRKVRNWLVGEAGAPPIGAARIFGAYVNFQEWYYEKQLAAGFSDEDIQDYPTAELMTAMEAWIAQGEPI